MQEATVTAADLANQKEVLAQLQASVTTEFNLACIKLGTQNTASTASVSEVLDHIESITVVQVRLRATAVAVPGPIDSCPDWSANSPNCLVAGDVKH